MTVASWPVREAPSPALPSPVPETCKTRPAPAPGPAPGLTLSALGAQPSCHCPEHPMEPPGQAGTGLGGERSSVGYAGPSSPCQGLCDQPPFRWDPAQRGLVAGCSGQMAHGREDFSLPCGLVTPTSLSRLPSSFMHSLINPVPLSASFALLFYGLLPSLFIKHPGTGRMRFLNSGSRGPQNLHKWC